MCESFCRMQGTPEEYILLQKAAHHIQAGDKAFMKDDVMGAWHVLIGSLVPTECAYISTTPRFKRKSKWFFARQI